MKKNQNSNDSAPVDDLITAIPGEWTFDEQVVNSFDDHVRKSVPMYEEVQRMIVEMSEWFVRDGSTIYDIGSSTGETILLLQEKHSNKVNVRFIGIDNSSAMIEAARKKCQSENVEFLLRDATEIAGFKDADLIVSLYTLQFLPLKERREVLKRIYRDLHEGGAFILVEKIRSENSFFEDLWLELYWDFKRNQGLSDDMILQKARSLRGVLLPLTLTQNIDLLRDVGFSIIDTFSKWYNFAGIIALKSYKAKSTGDSKITVSKKQKSRI
ncbi:MAG: methyltransferase domain-containing protein [Candidatus Hodarchaeales archaeon]